MGILQIITDAPGQINSPNLRRVKIITTDNLATVTAAGYLNPASLQGFVIYNTDEIVMWYGAVGTQSGITSPGTMQVFIPSFSSGIITLTAFVNGANVLLPVVAGDIPIYNGTTGQISDSGFLLATQELTQIITLNQANITGAYAAPVQLIAAPGAGKNLLVTYANVYTNFQTAAFTAGGVAIVQWGNTVHGAGTNALSATIPSSAITASASQMYALPGQSAGNVTGITNLGLFWSNQTQAFASGNAASTVVVTISYLVVNGSV